MAMQFSEEDREKLRKDKSAIYQKRSDKVSKEELANLSGKEKWQHFVDYYLKATVAVILVLCLVIGGVVHTYMTRKMCALYIVIQKDIIPEEQVPFVQEAVAQYLKLDTDREEVMIDISCSDRQLQAYFYAGTADILITDEESFQKWGQAEYFYTLEEYKEVAFYKEYDETLRYRSRYVTGNDVLNDTEREAKEAAPGDETEYTCGLYLTDSKKYRQIGGAIEKPVLGIAVTTKHLSEAEAFVKYMLDNSKELSLNDFRQ